MLTALTISSQTYQKMALYVSTQACKFWCLLVPCHSMVFVGYHLSGIYFLQVSLLTESGNTKDDLKLPTDENLLSQVITLAFVCNCGTMLFQFLMISMQEISSSCYFHGCQSLKSVWILESGYVLIWFSVGRDFHVTQVALKLLGYDMTVGWFGLQLSTVYSILIIYVNDNIFTYIEPQAYVGSHR